MSKMKTVVDMQNLMLTFVSIKESMLVFLIFLANTKIACFNKFEFGLLPHQVHRVILKR